MKNTKQTNKLNIPYSPAGLLGNIMKGFGQKFGPKREKNVPDIENEVPYCDIYSKFLIDIYGGVHAFYEIEAPSADVAAAEKLTMLQGQLSNIIEFTPETIVQIQWNYSTSGDYRKELIEHSKYHSDYDFINGIRKDRSEELLEEVKKRTLIRSSTVLVVSAHTDPRFPLNPSKNSEAGLSSQNMQAYAITEEEAHECIKALDNADSIIQDAFRKAGIKMAAMSADSIAQYLYSIFNQDMANDWGIPCVFDYNKTPFNDAWICQDWSRGDYYYKIGDYYHTWITINEKPQETSPRIVERITTGLGFNGARIVFSIRKLDKSMESDALRNRRNLTLSRMREPLNWIDRISNPKKVEDIQTAQYNVEAKDEIDELNDALSQMRGGMDYLCQGQVAIHTWSKDLEEIKRRREIISARINDMNKARPLPETHATHRVMLSSLPGSLCNLPRKTRMLGRMAADLVPLHKGFEGGDDPLCIFRNRTGGLVTLNLFQQGVANAPLAFVSGGSGSGKSFLVNQLLLQHITEKTLVIIFDIGGSYADILRLLGGQVIAFNKDVNFRINPLQIYGGEGQLEEPTPDIIRRICKAMESILLDPKDEGGRVPQYIISTIARGIEAVFSDAKLHGKNFVSLSDLFKIVKGYPDHGVETADRLKPFVGQEMYGEYFDGPTTVDLQSPVICFDLKGIKHDKRLCAAITPIIINYVYDLIGNSRGKRKILVMDEMWEFLNNPVIADFIIEAFKTFRKENTLTLGVSQNLWSDVGSNKTICGAIVQNTETWFLLDQGKEEVARNVSAMIGLTDGQQDLLKNLKQKSDMENGKLVNYREALLIRASHSSTENSGVIRIQSNPTEYWLATTNPEETPLMDKMIFECNGDTLMAARILGQQYPCGKALGEKYNKK